MPSRGTTNALLVMRREQNECSDEEKKLFMCSERLKCTQKSIEGSENGYLTGAMV